MMDYRYSFSSLIVFLCLIVSTVTGIVQAQNKKVPPPLSCARRIAVENLSQKQVKKAAKTELKLGEFNIQQGDIIDVYKKPTGENRTRVNLAKETPEGFSAIFIGIFDTQGGIPTAILDLGRGKVKCLPIKNISHIRYSTAHVTPTKDSMRAWVKRTLKTTYDVTMKLLIPGAVNSIPTLTAMYGSYKTFEWALHTGYELSQSHPTLMTGVGATVAASLAHPSTRGITSGIGSLLLEGTWKGYKAVGHIGKFFLILPFKGPEYYQQIKTIVGIFYHAQQGKKHNYRKMSQAAFKGTELFKRGVRRAQQNGITAFFVPGRSDRFTKKQRQAYQQEASAIFEKLGPASKYLHETVGFVDPSHEKTRDISVWFLQGGSWFMTGPFAVPHMDTIVMTPMKSRWLKSMRAWLKGKKGFPANPIMDHILRVEILVHEYVHGVIGQLNFSEKKKPWRTFLEEHLADYFASSALDFEKPIMWRDFTEDHALREGVYRGEYNEAETGWLNFNTPAQLIGAGHRDSQVLFRIMWRLRDQIGRKTLDPQIKEALFSMKKIWETTRANPTKPPQGTKSGSPIHSYSHIREAYAYIASVYHQLNQSDASHANLLLEFAGNAGFSQEAIRKIASVLKTTQKRLILNAETKRLLRKALDAIERELRKRVMGEF